MKMKEIPTPTPEIIKEHLNMWDTSEDAQKYPAQEKALNFLFSTACPLHDDMTHIILKVSALNDFYSTNIFDTYSVAQRILSIRDFKERVENGDHSLVNELAQVSIKGKTINFYSFASKYCSHHCPRQFPIYDSYVEKMLLHYNKHSKFMPFKKSDLKVYEHFLSAIKSFQQTYGLENFSLRDIDIFLWQAGKEYFPKSYGKKKVKDTAFIQSKDKAGRISGQFKKYLITKLNRNSGDV